MYDIFVGRIMTSPVKTVREDAGVTTVAHIMSEKGIGAVVVTDENRSLKGILTARDYVKMVSDGCSFKQTTVGDYMTDVVMTASAQDGIRDLANLMTDKGFHHVPVVDAESKVIGMVTTTDLTAYLSSIQSPSPS